MITPPLPDYQDALKLALGSAGALAGVERVRLLDAAGRVLAEQGTVLADRDLPPFDRAQMDGYAIRAAEYEKGRPFTVAGAIPAGSPAHLRVGPGECVAIATGAPLPPDVDTVIQHEVSDRGNGSGHVEQVRFKLDSIASRHAVHARGSDAKSGQRLIEPGTALGAHHLGIAAAVGAVDLLVRPKPRAIVVTSGDEIVPSAMGTQAIQPHQVRNSNGPMVWELLKGFGAQPVAHEHLADDRESTLQAVAAAVERCDLLITIGGVSAGNRDFFPEAFKAAKVAISLRGAAIQPGRPILVGRAPNGCVAVGLPGNPVSVLACACLFVWPLVRTMLGTEAMLPWRSAELAEPVKPNPTRRAFRPAMLREDGRAVVPAWAGSGDLVHTSSTQGLLELPMQREPVAAGTALRFLPWP